MEVTVKVDRSCRASRGSQPSRRARRGGGGGEEAVVGGRGEQAILGNRRGMMISPDAGVSGRHGSRAQRPRPTRMAHRATVWWIEWRCRGAGIDRDVRPGRRIRDEEPAWLVRSGHYKFDRPGLTAMNRALGLEPYRNRKNP